MTLSGTVEEVEGRSEDEEGASWVDGSSMKLGPGAWLHPLQPTVHRAPCCSGVDSKAVAPQTIGGRVERCSPVPLCSHIPGRGALAALRRWLPGQTM